MGKISVGLNDQILIEDLRKKLVPKKLLNEFSSKYWSMGEFDSLLRRIDATGSADGKVGSGRPMSARTSVSQHHKRRRVHLQSKKMLSAPTKVHGKLSKSRGLQEVPL